MATTIVKRRKTWANDPILSWMHKRLFEDWLLRGGREVLNQLTELRSPHCSHFSDLGQIADWSDYTPFYDCDCGGGEGIFAMQSTIPEIDEDLRSRPVDLTEPMY